MKAELKKKWCGMTMVLCAGLIALPLWADTGHGASHDHGSAHVYDFGEPGNRRSVDRTVRITLGDMYYRPQSLDVKNGETVRFILHNEGELLHEFNLGDAEMHLAHQHEMLEMRRDGILTPTGVNAGHVGHDGSVMRHDDPNSVLVNPGESAELVWTFSNEGIIEFACNVLGHYQAGMVGKLTIQP